MIQISLKCVPVNGRGMDSIDNKSSLVWANAGCLRSIDDLYSQIHDPANHIIFVFWGLYVTLLHLITIQKCMNLVDKSLKVKKSEHLSFAWFFRDLILLSNTFSIFFSYSIYLGLISLWCFYISIWYCPVKNTITHGEKGVIIWICLWIHWVLLYPGEMWDFLNETQLYYLGPLLLTWFNFNLSMDK